ncbi:UNVERIFIED_ORG: hypothetical protein RHOFW104R5_39190 [Rhodanobacter sp. FW104-R5]
MTVTRCLCAVTGELYEFRLQSSQFLQLAAHIEKLVLDQSACLRTGPFTFELQQSGDLLQREAHGLGAADELQARQIMMFIAAHAA